MTWVHTLGQGWTSYMGLDETCVRVGIHPMHGWYRPCFDSCPLTLFRQEGRWGNLQMGCRDKSNNWNSSNVAVVIWCQIKIRYVQSYISHTKSNRMSVSESDSQSQELQWIRCLGRNYDHANSWNSIESPLAGHGTTTAWNAALKVRCSRKSRQSSAWQQLGTGNPVQDLGRVLLKITTPLTWCNMV